MVDNVHAIGGVQNGNITVETTCVAFCLAQSDCVAIDFDTANKGCWIFTDVAKAAATSPMTGTRHYTRVKANCASKYKYKKLNQLL